MEFFNKKEEVIDLKLTQFGRFLLSKGKLKPVFYSFFDESNLVILVITISTLLILSFFFIFKTLVKDKVFFHLVIFFVIQSAVAIYAAKVDQVQGRYAAIPGILLI